MFEVRRFEKTRLHPLLRLHHKLRRKERASDLLQLATCHSGAPSAPSAQVSAGRLWAKLFAGAPASGMIKLGPSVAQIGLRSHTHTHTGGDLI